MQDNLVESNKVSWLVFIINLTVTFIFISDWIQESRLLYLPSGTRHIFILLVFVSNYLLFGVKLKLPTYYKVVLFFFTLYLCVSFFLSTAPAINYALGYFFSSFFIFLFILGCNTKTNKEALIKILEYLLIFVLLMSVYPFFQGIILTTTLRNHFGIFRELGAFGAALNVATIASLALYIIKSKKKFLYCAIILSFIVMMTILKKSIISSFIIWIIFLVFQTNSTLRLKLISGLFIGFVLVFLLVGNELIGNITENKEYLDGVGAEGHVRLGMYLASYNIASDNLPFGSGLGTFASLASITNWYSNIYYQYGVAYIGANSPDDVAALNHTLLDTFWPHILGELGFLGTVLYLILWCYPLVRSFKIYLRVDNDEIKGFAFFVFLTFLVMTWEGFTLYTPEIPSFVLIHSGIGGLCFYHLHRIRDNYQL
jgi:hypothetical protein